MTQVRIFLVTFLLLGALFILPQCQKSDSADSSGASFSTVYTNTLSTACVQCHQPGGSATTNNNTTIDFSSKSLAYSTLVASNVKGVLTTGHCPGVNLVVASSPTTSYLLGTVITSYSSSNFASVAGCLPYNHVNSAGINISTAQQNDLVSWIQDGAKNN